MGYIYKYININNTIEYIGKTTRPIQYRIIEHQSLDLQDFQGDIFYAEITDDYELDIVEKALIRKYQPIKNKKDYHSDNFIFQIDESLLKWKKYTKEKEKLVKTEVEVYCDLKKLLFLNKMSQNQLSNMTGIRLATICDMCNGKAKNLPLKNIGRICKALNCEVGDLIKIA